MTRSASFIVRGDIKTKQRPRATVIGGHARVYTPADTINYENYIKSEFLRQCGSTYFKDVPLCIFVKAYFSPSQELRKMEGYERTACENQKDCDNILKIFLDGLQGVCFDNDKQFTSVTCKKAWSDEECEYVYVEIREDEHHITINRLKAERRLHILQNRLEKLQEKKKPTLKDQQDMAKVWEQIQEIQNGQQ